MKKQMPIICSVLILLISQAVWAQSEAPRIELSGLFTLMSKFDATDRRAGELVEEPEEFTRRLNMGIGARATFNVTSYLGVETEWNMLPQDNEYTGRKSQLFYGLKVGLRRAKFGLFAKARPGYMYLSKDFCDSYPQFEDNYRCLGTYRKNPAFDIGGIVEFYSKRRSVVRIDVGDTIVHFNHIDRYRPELGPEFNTATHIFGGTTHSLQVSVGFGIRF